MSEIVDAATKVTVAEFLNNIGHLRPSHCARKSTDVRSSPKADTFKASGPVHPTATNTRRRRPTPKSPTRKSLRRTIHVLSKRKRL